MAFKKDFLQTIKTKLESEQRTLSQRLASIATRSNRRGSPLTARWQDLGEKEDENAAEVATYQDNLSLEQNLERSLQEVTRALKTIDEGTYGRCVKCGREIEPERLEIFPSAQHCMEHKSEAG